MRGRMLWMLTGLGCAVALVGCVSLGRLPEVRPTPRPSRAGDGPPGPELRIPADAALARGPDVPLVPIPPPPLGRGEAAATTSQPPASEPAKPTPPPRPDAVRSTPVSRAPVAAASDTEVSVPVAAPKAAARPAVLPGGVVTPRWLYQQASQKMGNIDSYIVRLTRREMVKEKMGAEEVLLFKFRKKPWSVYLKWLGKEGQGREVLYVNGQHQGKIHTLLAAGDIPFVPAGRRMALAPDSILVKSACRHPITQAGIAASIERVGMVVAALERGDRKMGTVQLQGPAQRPEFDRPVYSLEHTVPPGLDPSLPNGGRRTYFFSPTSHLPTLVTTRDEKGREVEYYRYDRLQPGVKLDDEDFDPEHLWGKPKTTAAATPVPKQ